MLSTKRVRPALTPSTSLPRKPIGSVMMSPITSAALRQDVQQHVLELQDRLDDPDDGVDRLRDEAAVGGLQLVDARVERVARLHVLLGERVDERVLLVVDVAARAGRTGSSSLLLGVLADLLQVGGQLGDVVADLGAALGDPQRAPR